MARLLLPALMLLIGAALALGGAWLMRPAPTPTLTAGEVEALVADTMRARPELVVEAIRSYQAREQERERAEQTAALDSARELLERNPADPVFGPDDASVTLIEFFDYRCGYCKRVLDDVMALVDTETDLRVVFKELPILGPDSETASKAALAAWRQGPEPYRAYHEALMRVRGPLDEARIFAIAENVGLDLDRLRDDMGSEEIRDHIRETRELAASLGIRGTPAFVVGSRTIPGAVGRDTLARAIAEARGSGG